MIEAAQQGAGIQSVVTAPALLTSLAGKQVVSELARRNVEILEVGEEVFKSLALKDDPQGIAAVIRQAWLPLEQVRLSAQNLWIALDSVADPGNLGTILRTVDAVGGSGVILLEQSTDPYDPTAVRASMGAVFSQKLVHSDFGTFAAWRKGSGACVIGTSGAAAEDYHQARYPSEFVLLMGSERHGLGEEALKLCDQVVSIPMSGRSDSLNLAVATAVVLYEIFNPRRDREREGNS